MVFIEWVLWSNSQINIKKPRLCLHKLFWICLIGQIGKKQEKRRNTAWLHSWTGFEWLGKALKTKFHKWKRGNNNVVLNTNIVLSILIQPIFCPRISMQASNQKSVDVCAQRLEYCLASWRMAKALRLSSRDPMVPPIMPSPFHPAQHFIKTLIVVIKYLDNYKIILSLQLDVQCTFCLISSALCCTIHMLHCHSITLLHHLVALPLGLLKFCHASLLHISQLHGMV